MAIPSVETPHKAEQTRTDSTDHKNQLTRVTGAGLLVALGIIYGDIGTSPLYVLKAIIGERGLIDQDLVYGGISCIFWTLTLQTTFKYVILTLRADNRGEGGIFSLYALVRRLCWLMALLPRQYRYLLPLKGCRFSIRIFKRFLSL
jgi:K+ transporter